MDTKKTIMVVDDNPDIITIVRTILEGKGYNVLSAFSGAELFTGRTRYHDASNGWT
jgi:CheY-like chemotaxis protein